MEFIAVRQPGINGQRFDPAEVLDLIREKYDPKRPDLQIGPDGVLPDTDIWRQQAPGWTVFSIGSRGKSTGYKVYINADKNHINQGILCFDESGVEAMPPLNLPKSDEEIIAHLQKLLDTAEKSSAAQSAVRRASRSAQTSRVSFEESLDQALDLLEDDGQSTKGAGQTMKSPTFGATSGIIEKPEEKPKKKSKESKRYSRRI